MARKPVISAILSIWQYGGFYRPLRMGFHEILKVFSGVLKTCDKKIGQFQLDDRMIKRVVHFESIG